MHTMNKLNTKALLIQDRFTCLLPQEDFFKKKILFINLFRITGHSMIEVQQTNKDKKYIYIYIYYKKPKKKVQRKK